MKLLIMILLLFSVLFGSGQKVLTFKDVLKTAEEISITDSFLIDYSSFVKMTLDKKTAINFYKIIERKEDDSLDEADYSIGGKITSHKDFDILFLCAQQYLYNGDIHNVATHETKMQSLFFVLLDKEGNYKNNFLAAMDFSKKDNKKTITRKISSWVYTDLKIIQHTVTESWRSYIIYLPFSKADTKTSNFSMEYHVNDYGVFVAYPKYSKN